MTKISEITLKTVNNSVSHENEKLIRGILRDPIATQLVENAEATLQQKSVSYEYPVGLRYSDDALSLIARKNGEEYVVSSVEIPYSEAFSNLSESSENINTASNFLYAKSVIFYNMEGTQVLDSARNITHGEIIQYGGDTPQKESSISNDYAFVGWSLYKNVIVSSASDSSLINLSSYPIVRDVKLYAAFMAVSKKYSVTYCNYDGTEFKIISVEYGSDATPTPKSYNPEKPSTNQYSYIFSGWGVTPTSQPSVNCLRNITRDTIVYACFTEVSRAYTVTFKNGSSTIGTSTTQYGFFAVYEGETPVKASTEDYMYTFSGWNRDRNATSANQYALANITSDTTVYAIFTETAREFNAEIVSYPTKMTYSVGDNPDYSGIEIKRILENQTRVDIPISQCTFTPSESDAITGIGDIPVTVSYRGRNIVTFTIHSVTGTARIAEYPDKMIYLVGETVDYTGLRVNGISGQTETDITTDCTLSPSAGYVVQNSNITVSVTYNNSVIDYFTLKAVPTTGFYIAAVATRT